MRENKEPLHEIFNPLDKACDICREMSRVYNDTADGAVYILPEECGNGYLKKSCVTDSAQIMSYDFTFCNGITMEEVSVDESFRLSFCLGDGFEWSLEGMDKTYYIQKGESCIFPAGTLTSRGRYEAGMRYRGIGIGMHPDRFAPVLEYFCHSGCALETAGIKQQCKKYRANTSVMELVRQIMDCPFDGLVRRLYMEGKLLELAAVYLNEMIREEDKTAAAPKLSREDVESLERIRSLLDESFAEPLTISELAKAFYINEYKLKSGFKELYGQSPYSYVLDRRMHTARLLLDENKMKVKEVAGMVGYTNISHFIEAFRKKFGVNPGAYLREII